MAGYSGPFPFTNTGTLTSVTIDGTTFVGNVSNSGTITGAISVGLNAKIYGGIIDSGFIGGGIAIDATSHIDSTKTAISITGATFGGGINTAGIIQSDKSDIYVDNTAFSGNIVNSGILISS
ncbi:MAG TPA: hypothetical protein VKS78_14445, partial [Roseiarcus sp.]|nr:hypothetical protein [Roseiarcus sp.]